MKYKHLLLGKADKYQQKAFYTREDGCEVNQRRWRGCELYVIVIAVVPVVRGGTVPDHVIAIGAFPTFCMLICGVGLVPPPTVLLH